MKRALLPFAVAMALVPALPETAGAEVAKGTFRLHLESTFFSFYKGELDPEGPGDQDFDGVTFGIGAPEREFSLSRQSVGFGLALIPNLVLGARVTMALLHEDEDGRDDTLFVTGFVPYLEYVFLDGRWRPFVTGVVGMEGWFGEIGDDDYRLVNFVGGAGGGVHVFLAPQFSIDATLLFTFAVGGGELEVRRGADIDLDFWCLDLGLLLGLSGWL
jgi:hypothetical protein